MNEDLSGGRSNISVSPILNLFSNSGNQCI